MKRERFDPKSGKWVPIPEERETSNKAKEINIDARAKGSRYNPNTGEWAPIPENPETVAANGAEDETSDSGRESDVVALRDRASKLMKELSNPKVPVDEAHKMWVEYRAIQEQLGENADKSDKERIPGYL